ncbi:MAG TPA: hypothetical protein DCE41_25210 [Cytophagales bacterium]|nr:hypothetical protein [Cytophagales bacterium]HAA24217.1 hypothetical protein [Cytophagales bacterium]HAP64416.1 hypothetical protein [Cytophagales bacterium]
MSTKGILTAIALGFLWACQPTVEEWEPLLYPCAGVVQDSLNWDGRVVEFQSALDWATSQGMPGVVAYLRTPDGVAWSGASGYASLEESIPMRTCYRMLIASVSKVFVASAVFQLVEAGAVSLDDPLGDYLQGQYMDRIRNAKVVTIRQLLNHTSGLYDYLWPTKFELWSIQEPFHSAEVEEKLKLAYGKRPTHEPGTTYSYSNTNYVLLGLLIEELSGQPLDVYLQQAVFNPLGLTSAYMGTVAQPIPPGTPEGYLALQGSENLQPSAFYYHNDLATGDGGVAIRMDELGHFLEEIISGDFLSESSRAAMQEAFELPEDWQGKYHMRNSQGLEIFDTPYGTAYGHTGAIVGFLTTAWYFPESGACLVVSLNGVSPRIEEAREELIDTLLDLVVGP